MLDKSSVGTCGDDADDDDASRCFSDIIDDSPEPQKHQKKVVELDSSHDEDMDFSISIGKNMYHLVPQKLWLAADASCPRSQYPHEDALHCLRNCPKAMQIWDYLGFT